MRNQLILLLLFFLPVTASFSQTTTLSGSIKDADSGELLLFSSIHIKEIETGTVSNEYGFYSLTIENDKIAGDSVEVEFSFVGYDTYRIKVKKGQVHRLDIELGETANQLDEVVVVAEASRQQKKINSTQMSEIRLPMKQIARIPSIGGEVDVMKVIQLMPGVSRGTEGTTGMFVRGGDADQNLVLLDEATVYNVGHLFGFFSVFNSDAIKDMTIIKGGFPANYGGRLSSILDIRMKDGHDQKIHGQGGIGILSSRITLEGPVIKEKMSFLFSARRTYIDQFLKVVSRGKDELPYYFYDINAKLNFTLSDKDRLFYSMYLGDDVLNYSESEEDQESSSASILDFGFNLGNITNTLRWNRIYNEKLFSNVSLISTNFNYDIRGNFFSNNVLVRSTIQDVGAKGDFQYYQSSRKILKFGASVIHHIFRPNVVSTSGEISEFLKSRKGQNIDFQELGIYGNYEYDLIENRLKMNGGLRFSGAIVSHKFYTGLEPRLSMKYSLNEKSSLKGSYSRMKQYMHRVSSSTITFPTDLWYPITSKVLPQRSNQLAMGYNYLFEKAKTLIEVEGYYKWMRNLIEFKPGAILILNDDFEEEIVQGDGTSYGLEVLVKKEEGKFNGWIGYTLSWSKRQFDELNQGVAFFAKYDRRHDVSLVVNYDITKRWMLSAVWVYATGSRFTPKIGQYVMPNPTLTGIDVNPIYAGMNEVILSPSHRMDLNLVLKSKKKKRFESEWHFGAYNVYHRAQPFYVEIVPLEEEGKIGYKYQQPALFGFIPAIAYNFKF